MKIETITYNQLLTGTPESIQREPELIIVMPATDPDAADRSAQLMASRAGIAKGLILQVHDTDRAGFVAVANTVFCATTSRYLAYVAQDAFPGRFWLKRALEAVEKSQKGLLAFNDGKWMGALAAFGLVRRDWANRNYQGLLFYPDYAAHYGDVELTLLAMNEQQLTYDPNSVLVEVDWAKDQKTVNSQDRSLFRQRAAQGFDGRISNQHLLTLFS
jgi:hypothetical protein